MRRKENLSVVQDYSFSKGFREESSFRYKGNDNDAISNEQVYGNMKKKSFKIFLSSYQRPQPKLGVKKFRRLVKGFLTIRYRDLRNINRA